MEVPAGGASAAPRATEDASAPAARLDAAPPAHGADTRAAPASHEEEPHAAAAAAAVSQTSIRTFELLMARIAEAERRRSRDFPAPDGGQQEELMNRSEVLGIINRSEVPVSNRGEVPLVYRGDAPLVYRGEVPVVRRSEVPVANEREAPVISGVSADQINSAPATQLSEVNVCESEVPPPNGEKRAARPTRERDADARSTRSTRRRSEMEAKLQLARKELEAAEARARYAQAELNLLQCGDNSDNESIAGEAGEQGHIEKWLEGQAAPTHDKVKSPPPSSEKKSDIQELAQAIAGLTHRPNESKHIIELPYFNGASEEWLAFRRSFEDTAPAFTKAQNLARLRRTLQGKAREAVKCLLFTADDPCEVMKGLEARFGRPGALALAELERLKGLPRVSEQPNDICNFASQVRNSIAAIKSLGKKQYLSSPEAMKNLIEKMPTAMKYRWFVYHRSRRDEEQPELALVCDFLEIEADLCSDFAPPEVTWDTKRNRAPPEVRFEQRSAVKRSVHTAHEGGPRPSDNDCPECNEKHAMLDCRRFKDANVNERWEMAKRAKLCFKCLRYRHARPGCRAPTCRRCGRWHHVTLHSEQPPTSRDDHKVTTCNAVRSEEQREQQVISSVHTTNDGKAYLKIVPVDLYGPRGSVRVLALLDEGSTISLLDAEVARRIGVEGEREPITIETVGGKGIKKSDSQRVRMKIKGAHRNEKQNIEVRTIDNLRLAKQEVSREVVYSCAHLRRIRNQLIYKKEEPQLLLGQDNWGLIVTKRLRKGKPSEPVASLTGLGWALHGCDGRDRRPINFAAVHCSRLKEEETDSLVRRHFEIEALGVQPRRPSNDVDQRALEVLKRTTRRLPDGRFESGLIWKSDEEVLPDNYQQAHRRLINIEKKIDKDIELKGAYGEQINNLINKGYAEIAPATSTEGRTFYLPHFAVTHPEKRKVRIVLDAAAKFEGRSLNDALLPGPDLLQSLFGVLIRFREGPVAVVADIKEMFLRIDIREEDRDSLRFLWRGDRRTGRPDVYRMTSVIFGASSSPSTAIYVMNRNAEDYKEEFPAAVEAIRRNHYMDDYLQSFPTASAARETARQVQHIHSKAGFHLRGWASNEEEALADVRERTESDVVEFATEEKTLGLRWIMAQDALAFNEGFRNIPSEILEGDRVPTKREVTSAVMSTFDPMGFATPVLIQGKKLIQDIWRAGTGWDEKIEEEQRTSWSRYLHEVAVLKKLQIPRCLSPRASAGQLHTFCDASEEAYAAAAYWRTTEPDGQVRVSLIAGKARVTPTKPVSMPRLELQAAVLGSRLAASIADETGLQIERKVFWTDSSTVLLWIKSDPRKFKTFVAHRLAEVEELTKPQDWRWVPTKENPADDATRGTPNEFDNNARWFRGPAFLYEDEEKWPARQFKGQDTTTGEERNTHAVAATRLAAHDTPDPGRFSSWARLVRAMARVHQFIDLLREKSKIKRQQVNATKEEEWKPHRRAEKKKVSVPAPRIKERPLIPLEERHIRKAEESIIRRSQHESFATEISRLREGKPLENASRLKRIDVYLNDRGLLKLRSRTRKAQVEAKMSPVVLDGKHQVSQLLINHYHRKFLHGNTATVINELRQRYWILGLRSAARGLIHRCQWCRVRRGAPQVPPTGDLPSERLRHHQPPFTCTAVDYFGPMQVTVGRRSEKRWGALFTCLTTRAVHLELVPSLSTSSMIMALRRMSARRGAPTTMYSDNGTNFVGAHRELQEAAGKEGIEWKFIPPGCPSMGGAWERLVRSVKTALMAVLETKTPSEELLHTLLTEVEHIVNCRPLTHVSLDPSDEEALTPNHFLLGRSCGSPVLGEFEDHELIGRATWRTAQRLADHFWKRWLTEYLPTLMPRKITGRETEDPREGDVVLIVDATLPRNTWPRGEVQRVYPGPDGRVRVLDVRTAWGVLRRPTRRVVVLAPASLPKDGVLRTAGETVSDAP